MATVSDLVQRLRSEVLRDNAQPYLYSTDEIIRTISEGVKLFARHTHCLLQDVQLTTTAGTARYTLPPTVCYVRQVSLDGHFLTPYTRRAKPRAYSGRPTAYSTDSAQSSIKLWPIPDAAYTLTLDCAIVPAALSSSSTIPLTDEWLPTIMDYAASRLLNNNDPDGSQQIAAALFEKRWKEGLLAAKNQEIIIRNGDEPSAMPQYWTV